MFELPEYVTLAGQINSTLTGKTIQHGCLGNSPHKFVWYNRHADEFAALTQGKTIGKAHARGKWLFIPLEPGYVLLFGECGGRILYHPAGAKLPEKYHLWLAFTDGSSLTAMTQMWGAMELYELGQELHRQYIKGMRPTPTEPEFTYGYFSALIDSLLPGEKRSVKGFLTQEQLIPGLGNAITQDVLFRAGLHPKRPISDLSEEQRCRLYDAIESTVREVIAGSGRNDEYDLFNHPGGYVRLMDSKTAGRPCPVCETPIEKLQYLGGACYLCPRCQPAATN
jgi:formamidopyrimidine-DNA glycosylase